MTEPNEPVTLEHAPGLSLAAFRALRYTVDGDRLGPLLCPPYDVIDDAGRELLLAGDDHNAVGLILPRAAEGADAYARAAADLTNWVSAGILAVDADPALYVYEMRTADGAVTRGLLGAVELRDYADGVILPHENTMAGPVADRLALMTATQADLEPIYLVYDGGGAASAVVSGADADEPIARAVTPEGTSHRLWAFTDLDVHAAVAADLAGRRALIADGHHRYATYLEVQRRSRAERGPGPWDRGLALLVDSSSYGPQVHAIHRVLADLPVADAIERAQAFCKVTLVADSNAALEHLDAIDGFAAALTDGSTTAVVSEPQPELLAGILDVNEPAALAELDVTVLHRALLERVWGVQDGVDTVRYAHSVDEAIGLASQTGGTAVLLRPTPVAAVSAVAAAGARMPRKSTLFTPKPASGMVIRRFADDHA